MTSTVIATWSVRAHLWNRTLQVTLQMWLLVLAKLVLSKPLSVHSFSVVVLANDEFGVQLWFTCWCYAIRGVKHWCSSNGFRLVKIFHRHTQKSIAGLTVAHYIICF